jgi:phage terminase large subunit
MISYFSQDVFNQLDQRTRDKIFIDYNPSKDFWIERYRENSKAIFLHSTYKDNPFLTDGIVQKLESYNPYKKHSTYVKDGILHYNNKPVSEKNTPPPNVENIKNGTANRYMYEVYCLGLGSEKPNRIYKGWRECTDRFFEEIDSESYFGLDFGVSSPTAVVEVKFDGDKTFYVREVLYKPMSLMGMPLHEYLLKRRGVNQEPLIDEDCRTVCDSAKKTMVTDLAKGGLMAIPALKGAGSVSRTIGHIQSFKIVYTESSFNLKSEYLEYSWKIDRYGLAEEIPASNQNDHLLDAMGYIVSYLVNFLGIGFR